MNSSSGAHPVFGEAESALLEEAKARFEFEMKSAATLHSKSTLFLTLAGVFAAFLTSSVGRLFDHGRGPLLETGGLATFAICLGILTTAVFLLGRSVLSRSYQIPASPGLWVARFAHLKHTYDGTTDANARALAHLRYDLLDAWLEAAQQCAKRNESKSRDLERVSRLLSIAILMSFLGLILVLLSAVVG